MPLSDSIFEGVSFEIVENLKRVSEGLAETAETALVKHELEKDSLLKEIEALKAAYYHERDASEQAQNSLSEELNDLKKELVSERENVNSSANQFAQLKADYELILSKYEDLVETNLTLEQKNQELLENLTENQKHHLQSTQKYKLFRDAYAQQEQLLESAVTQIQQAHSSQGSYDKILKYYYEELRHSYEETRNAYEELRIQYNELETQHHELRGDYEAQKSSNQSLKAAYDKIHTAYEEIHAGYDTLKQEYDEVRHSLDQANAADTGMRGAYNELTHEYNQLRSAYDELRQGYEKLNGAYQSLNQRYEEHRLKYETSGASTLQLTRQYESLQAELGHLKNSYQQLEDLAKDQQESSEAVLQEKIAVENNLKAENESLAAKIVELSAKTQELEANVEILSQQREKTNEEAFQETMSQLISEKARADTLNQQLTTALSELEISNTTNSNLKKDFEIQLDGFKRENEQLREEIITVQAQNRQQITQFADGDSNTHALRAQYEEVVSNNGALKAQYEEVVLNNGVLRAQYEDIVSNNGALREQNVQLQTELRQEQENRESIQNTLNIVQAEYEQLKTRPDASPRKNEDSRFPEHVFEALAQSYKDFISSELPMDQGEMVLRLLEQLNKFKSVHLNLRDRDEEIQNLSSRFEDMQNENNRLLDTIALLESERNESEEVTNLKSLLEKKSKRLDELNKIIEDKNKELEKLRDVNFTAILKKESQTHEHIKEGVSKEAESLKKEIAELKEQNKSKSKELEDQAENLSVSEQRLKLMKEELEIFKLTHNEEIEALNKEIQKKVATEIQLKKQLLDMKSLEPSVQVIDKKLFQDSKTQPTQTKAPEDTAAAKKNEKPTSTPERINPETTKANETTKNSEEQRKAQGGFLSSVASFFLTENEQKKINKE